MIKSKNSKNLGFTLIEMLVSIAIVITSATVVVAIITATFRNSNDTSSQESLRQSGTAALSQATGMIRFADKFDGMTFGGSFSTTCQAPDSEESTKAVDSVTVTSQGKDHTIACDDDGFSLDSQPLLDPHSVYVTECSITCTQNSQADPPVISFDITLSTFTSEDTLQENNAGLYHLSQTVRMANLNQ